MSCLSFSFPPSSPPSPSLRAAGGMVDAGAEYQKALSEELVKLQRLYGGGDLTAFPEFKFTGECWIGPVSIPCKAEILTSWTCVTQCSG